MYIIKLVFSPVNLSYVNLITRPAEELRKVKEKNFPSLYSHIVMNKLLCPRHTLYVWSIPTLKELRVVVYSLENFVLLRVSSISKQRNEYVSSNLLSRECDSHLIPPTCKGEIFAKYQLLEKLFWKQANLDSTTAEFWIIFVWFW